MLRQTGEGAARNGDIRHPVGKHCGITIREFALCNNKVVRLGLISIHIQADAICFTGVVRNAELAVVKLNIVDERVPLIRFNIHAAHEGQTLKGDVAPLLIDVVAGVIVFCNPVSNEVFAVPLCAVDLSAERNQPVDGHRCIIGCLEGDIAHRADIHGSPCTALGMSGNSLLDRTNSSFTVIKIILGIAARVFGGATKLDLVIVTCT